MALGSGWPAAKGRGGRVAGDGATTVRPEDDPMIHQAFPHETLHAYTLAVECARWFRRARWPRGYAGLRDQGVRAAESLVLNIAEGRSFDNGNRSRHYKIAQGSAAEACAVLDLIDLPGATETQKKLRRASAMLTRLRE